MLEALHSHDDLSPTELKPAADAATSDSGTSAAAGISRLIGQSVNQSVSWHKNKEQLIINIPSSSWSSVRTFFVLCDNKLDIFLFWNWWFDDIDFG